jgi:hypothetical protein
MLPFLINKSPYNILLKVLFSVLIDIIERKKDFKPFLNINLLPINQNAQKIMRRLRA